MSPHRFILLGSLQVPASSPFKCPSCFHEVSPPDTLHAPQQFTRKCGCGEAWVIYTEPIQAAS